jgi:hypothetical protein
MAKRKRRKARLFGNVNAIRIEEPYEGSQVPVTNGTIAARGCTEAGSSRLLRVYARVFPGSTDVEDEDIGKKPWVWHESPAPVEGTVNTDGTWSFSAVPDVLISQDNTLIVWGDFEQDRCYDMDDCVFTGASGTGSGSGFMSSRGARRGASAVSALKPRFYRLRFIGSEKSAPGEDALRMNEVILAFDRRNSTTSLFLWRSVDAPEAPTWTLCVDHRRGRPIARLILDVDAEDNFHQPRWRAQRWEYLGRNLFTLQAHATAGEALPDILLEPA